MKTVILVPWRPGKNLRDLAWKFTREWWAQLGVPIVPGDTPGPFNRSAARNAAARAAGAWDMAVLCDADTIVRDFTVVRQAIAHAASTGRMVLPHNRTIRMSRTSTLYTLSGRPRWEVERVVHNSPLGVMVVPRQAWDTVGGFDERLTGWGGEDSAFLYAARTLVGLDRLPGEIWHLWHPPDSTRNRYIRQRGGPLMHRYRAVQDEPEGLRALLDER